MSREVTVWHRTDRAIDALLATRGGRARRESDLVEVLAAMSSSLRAGSTLPTALAEAGARAPGRVERSFSLASARVALGVSVSDALDELAAHLDVAGARLFAQALALRHRRGGDLAHPCQRLGDLLRERGCLRAEAESATAQARFSARAVLALPLGAALLAAWRAPDVLARLTSPGIIVLVVPSLVLLALAAVASRAIAVHSDPTRMRAAGVLQPGPARRGLVRIAGIGPRSRQAARLALTVAASGVLVAAALPGSSNLALPGTMVATACAAWWPYARVRAEQTVLAQVAAHGLDAVVEATIALLAAGAVPQEAAVGAIDAAPQPLRSLLAPGVQLASLGHPLHEALDQLPVVRASPPLAGWLQVLTDAHQHGGGAVAPLELLLRDARARRRELLRAAAATAGPRLQLVTVLLVVPAITWIVLLATATGMLEQLRAL